MRRKNLGLKVAALAVTGTIAEEFIEKLQAEILEENTESQLNIEFVEDGSKAFSHFGKSYGLFKNVRSLLLLKGNPGLPYFKEKIGYYGEKLLLFSEGEGVQTCWVGGTFDRSRMPRPASYGLKP